ncbi:neutral ceramidase A-like [Oscarella lobularis]|uniref:neutral ceramidase A-like n=1 Tax=Oscarella lobularis TaxID=121494 RepID=UPI003313536C
MFSFFVFFLLSLTAATAGTLRAGVAKVNATLPVGVPLAGYNHGERRVKYWPLPDPKQYTNFMTPSVGHLQTTWAKALLLDNGNTTFCFLTVDAIGADGTLRKLAWEKAAARGFTVPFDRFTVHGSHTHSGPGAVTPELLWSLAPATDILVPELQDMLASSLADAMLQAQANLQPAKMGINFGQLVGVTENRRADISPYVQVGSIDPHLGVIRVDRSSDGTPLATVWNFAIHGTCWGPDQMLSNGDIMGGACDAIETAVGHQSVAMFINADAGDIAPAGSACAGKPNYAGAPVIASAVQRLRDDTPVTSDDVGLVSASTVVDFGETQGNLTLARVANCTQGGPLDICSLCRVLRCDVNLHLDSAWIEESPTFTALNISIGGNHTLMVTVPGEALLELGWNIRNDSLKLGFTNTLLAGYSNNHMGYFATPDEYEVGGYEGLLTMWGIDTAEKVRQSCRAVAEKVSK